MGKRQNISIKLKGTVVKVGKVDQGLCPSEGPPGWAAP